MHFDDKNCCRLHVRRKKRAKDGSVLKTEWPFAMSEKIGKGASLGKGKSQSFT